MSYDLDESELRELYTTLNIKEPTHTELYHKFNRFRIKHPDEELSGTVPYLFFTKPDCNFYAKNSNGTTFNSEISNLYQFDELIEHSPRIFQNLQFNQGNGDFITSFQNAFESIDINDRIIKTRDSVETANDWKTVIGHKMNESLSANTFNVTFRDSRYLIIYKTLDAWINYIDLITKGYITPDADNRDNRILDYACSAYYFVTSEDAQTILYYCKFTGVFPLNIPDSIFGSSNKSLDLNIQFQYSYKDVTPAVIVDFNKINSDFVSQDYLPIYDNGMVQSSWVSGCYIEDTGKNYKLRWVA